MLTADCRTELADEIIKTGQEHGAPVTEALVARVDFDIDLMVAYDPRDDPDRDLLGNLFDDRFTGIRSNFEVCVSCGGVEQVSSHRLTPGLVCCGAERDLLEIHMLRPRAA